VLGSIQSVQVKDILAVDSPVYSNPISKHRQYLWVHVHVHLELPQGRGIRNHACDVWHCWSSAANNASIHISPV